MRYYASCENQASFETFLQGVVSKASSLPGVEGVYVL